ncbi:hypothetical protein ACQP60_11660 [Isoptericola variabilis]|uniref:hypothetical protein n=1 Tax=Isoptericola variabilis TaxID=139208 RepID=UPI003D1D0D6C
MKNYFGTTPHPDAALAREMWRDRLEVLWRQVLKDAEQLRPGAVRAGVAVVQRAAALDGLDAPQQFEIAPMGDAARYGGDGPDAARPSTAGCGP